MQLQNFFILFFSKTKNINLISGQVGITLNVDWYEPTIFNETSHVEASETKLQFFAGWFANPIFVNGKYPDIMRQKVKSNSVSVLPNLMLKFVFYLD